LKADGLVVGMQGELGRAELQFNFMPATEDEDYVQGLLEEAARSQYKEGFVLVRSSLAVQRLVAQSGLPAVVAGMLYASVPPMPWIDSDNRAVGRLLAERVLRAGHRTVLVLVRDRVLAGDYPFIDGVRDALSQANAGAEALIMRHLPTDHAMIREEVRRVLLQTEPLPGIVARSEPLADGAAEAVEAMGLEVGSDVTITLADWYRRHGSSFPRYPFARDTITAEEHGRRIARLLVRQALRRGTAGEHELISVTLEEPRAPRANGS
jgi:DNA-binding LacI/PurR family transcriptional regulator